MKGEKALGGMEFPSPGEITGLLPAPLIPPPTLSHTVHLGRLSPCPSYPPTQNRWTAGRLPRDGGGERRLPMSLRLEGFPDLLRAERMFNKSVCVCSTHYLTIVYVSYSSASEGGVHMACISVYTVGSVRWRCASVGCECRCGDAPAGKRTGLGACWFGRSPVAHLAFCSCLSRMLSRRWGLGMKAMSPPSFTSRPIHQSLLYFWGWGGTGRGGERRRSGLGWAPQLGSLRNCWVGRRRRRRQREGQQGVNPQDSSLRRHGRRPGDLRGSLSNCSLYTHGD